MYSTKKADEIGGRFPIAVEVTVAVASFRRYHIVEVLLESETPLQEVGIAEAEVDVSCLRRI